MSPASNAVYGCCCSGVVVVGEVEEFVAVALLFSIFLCVLILCSLFSLSKITRAYRSVIAVDQIYIFSVYLRSVY